MALVSTYRQGNYVAAVDDENLTALVYDNRGHPAPRKIVARFNGETAWMDAERKVNDLALADMYG